MKFIKINRHLIFVSIFLSIVVTFFSLKVLAQTPYPGPTDSVDPYPAPNATLPAAAPSSTTYEGIVTLDWGEIAFDDFVRCTSTDTNRWSQTALYQGPTQLFSGWWPVGGTVQESISTPPKNLMLTFSVFDSFWH